jgi:LacI family transcriptional regulator
MKRVAIIIETWSEDGRAILTGIIRYLNERGPWQLDLELNNIRRAERLDRWSGDGVLARTANAGIIDRIWQLDVPTVIDTEARIPDLRRAPVAPFPWGKIAPTVPVAVDHLVSRGLRSLAYLGYSDRNDYNRGSEFMVACQNQKVEHAVFVLNRELGSEHEQIGQWLQSLPKPIGVVGGTDERALSVLAACQSFEMSVPDEVAVIGAGNDFFLCSLATPTLSSIRMAYEEVGYHGAARLDAMMHGRPPTPDPRLTAHRVVPRGSTDLLASDDPLVKQATQLIRDRINLTEGVEALVGRLGVSRRTLERRFVAALGRTPGDELRRRRVERAMSMLEHTELPAAEVARRCGFNAPARLTEAMRREVGAGPAEYRKRVKMRL